ncbi:DNA cytosine methyltransferase [Corallococcus sp. 4LFB]|uniref:DNA cytosine methyltransferase n=1 Tax=Corallococcus sp. 4LFB TaxID=3383249 RepID=UPI003976A79D
MAKLKALSLFSGCGGFCEGVHLAGFDVRTAVEWDKFAAATYRYNFPETRLVEGDVRDFLRGSGTKERAEHGLDELDLLFGGPPCQGYSQIGTRKLTDERNDLYLEFVRVLARLKPRAFIMENVPNLLLLNKGHYKHLVLEALRGAGYSNTTVLRVVASDYGVPQERNRVFFIGTHDRFEFPHNMEMFASNALARLRVKRPVTVWEAIGDLPKSVVPSGCVMPYPEEVFSPFQREMRIDFDGSIYSSAVKKMRGIQHHEQVELHNHHTKEIQERRLALIALLQAGKKADSLPKAIWDGKRPEKWRRLHPDQPAYTLLANMHRDLSEFVHPSLQRWITVREAARLQSFHDGFVFVGSEWQQLKQIGNAVPPLLALAMGTVAKLAVKALRPRVSKGGRSKQEQLKLQIA